MQAFQPEYAALAAEFASQKPAILVAKVDSDENKDLAQLFKIAGLPTLVWFEGSDALATYDDEASKEGVTNWVGNILHGYSRELKSADIVKKKEAAVVAVFKPGTNENDDEIRSAYRKRTLENLFII